MAIYRLAVEEKEIYTPSPLKRIMIKVKSQEIPNSHWVGIKLK
jgi:hypothetical protein